MTSRFRNSSDPRVTGSNNGATSGLGISRLWLCCVTLSLLLEHRSVDWDAGARDRASKLLIGEPAFDLAAQLEQAIDVNSGCKPFGFQKEHCVFDIEVASRARRIGAAAQTADRRIEPPDSGPQDRRDVGEAKSARVVEMGGKRHPWKPRLQRVERALDLSWKSVTDRVGEHDLRGAKPR